MIPKVIHYAWFGGGEHSDLERRCMASWGRLCPGWRIVRWDEASFDVGGSAWCREACERRRWAFASDYVRLWALAREGGVYLDTDVEMLRPFPDGLLAAQAFLGFESDARVGSAVMGAEAGSPLVEALLARYEGRHFVLPDGSLDETPNVVALTRELERRGFAIDGSDQERDGVRLCRQEVLVAKDWLAGRVRATDATVCVHHFEESWVSGPRRAKNRLMHLAGPRLVGLARSVLGRPA